MRLSLYNNCFEKLVPYICCLMIDMYTGLVDFFHTSQDPMSYVTSFKTSKLLLDGVCFSYFHINSKHNLNVKQVGLRLVALKSRGFQISQLTLENN